MTPERCDACGFDGATYDDAALLDAPAIVGAEVADPARGAGPDLRIRPAPEVWSAIEYAAHSRDVTAFHVFGVEQALTVDEPAIPAIAGRPRGGGRGRATAPLSPMKLSRHSRSIVAPGVPDRSDAGPVRGCAGSPSVRTASTCVACSSTRFHDSRHHLLDVERGFAQLRGRAAARCSSRPCNSRRAPALASIVERVSSIVSRWVVRKSTGHCGRPRRRPASHPRRHARAVDRRRSRRVSHAALCGLQELIEASKLDVARPNRRRSRSPRTFGRPPDMVVVSAGVTEVYPESFRWRFGAYLRSVRRRRRRQRDVHRHPRRSRDRREPASSATRSATS